VCLETLDFTAFPKRKTTAACSHKPESAFNVCPIQSQRSLQTKCGIRSTVRVAANVSNLLTSKLSRIL